MLIREIYIQIYYKERLIFSVFLSSILTLAYNHMGELLSLNCDI